MADYEPASFYAPWPLFGKKFSAQLDEIRHNQDALAPIVDATGYDLTVGSRELRDSAVFSREWGQEDFHNKFRIRWSKGPGDVEFQCNQGTEAVPNWETYFYIGCSSRDVNSEVPFKAYNDLWITGDFYINGVAFASAGEANTASNLSGDEGLFSSKVGTDLQFKSLTAGSNITLSSDANAVTIASTASGGGSGTGFYGVVFKETEAGGGAYRDDQLNVDSEYFYLSESNTDTKPILSFRGFDQDVTITGQLNVENGFYGPWVQTERAIVASPTIQDPITLVAGAQWTARHLVGDVNTHNALILGKEEANAKNPVLALARSRAGGATVQDADVVASIIALGKGDTTYEVAGAINFGVDTAFDGSSPGDNNMPGKIFFNTQRPGSGSTTGTAALILHPDQHAEFRNDVYVWNHVTASSFYTVQFGEVAYKSDITPGFYGVTFKETEAGGGVYQSDQLNVDSTYFYLSEGGDGKPILSALGKTFGWYSHQQSSGALEWAVNHGLNTTRLNIQVYDDAHRHVIPDTIDTSNPDTTYFYFSSLQAGFAQFVAEQNGIGSVAPLTGITFAESESGGYSKKHTTFVVDNTAFYLRGNANGDVVLGSALTSQGEANTASSLGGDADVFSTKSGVDLQFRGITAGEHVTVTQGTNDITVAVPEMGPGFYGVTFKESASGGPSYKDDTFSFDSQFFYISTGGDGNPVVSSTNTGGSGEANTASNLAGDEGIFSAKSGVDLRFKSLTAGTNVTLASDANAITISASGSGGGGGGFYGVIFKETKAGGPVYRDDQLNVDSTYFYLSSSTDAKPLLSLNGVPKMEVHHKTAAAVEWEINHSLNTTYLIAQAWDTGNKLVIPDTADTSNSATAYFYFHTAMAGYVTLSGIPGL